MAVMRLQAVIVVVVVVAVGVQHAHEYAQKLSRDA
jgi:hypothetical protein